MSKQIMALGLHPAIAAMAYVRANPAVVGAQAATPAATASASGFKVGLVTDVGRVDVGPSLEFGVHVVLQMRISLHESLP